MPRIGPFAARNPFILAPMAGVSELPFRVLALEMGAALAPTELISAKGLEYLNRRTREYLRHAPVEQPFWVQLFGGEPRGMAIAAERAVAAGAHMLDVNMGCPVKKVTKTGAGSALLGDPARAALIITEMRRAVGDRVPVTAKLRSGWDSTSIGCVDLARQLEDAGAAAVALHARTRAQGYGGRADWSLIAQLKRAVRIPVIGNGDVMSVADARRMLETTGCDFVMVGRGALGNPWIFRALAAGVDAGPPAAAERLTVILRHLGEHIAFHGDQGRAVRSFRPHLVWYSKGVRGGAAFREHVMQLDGAEAVRDACARFFRDAVVSGEPEPDDGVDYATALG
ncbi:MAG: tRNA dihydrouridine synthase DusB [Deltaproteobacteria bacterium]|nr:tRNA dihydrouridine synthase DusB [Deltaproteobacteria bacterium]